MQVTKVFILYTGGTIGMGPKDENDPYSPLEPKPLALLLEYLPGFSTSVTPDQYRSEEAKRLADKNAAAEAEEIVPFIELPSGNVISFGHTAFDPPVDSADIGPKDWAKMANAIGDVYDRYDGFIILHGTDTMAFTSSALSFMFENLAKPVVITGSQLPISSMRTDAVLNLVNAIHIAGHKATDLPLIPEVIISFADRIIRGCRATKVSTSDWAGFDSPNFPLLGTIGEHIKINTRFVMDLPGLDKGFYATTDFNKNVFNVGLFPGFENEQVKKLFQDPSLKGYILRTYGTGNVPSDEGFLQTIADAVQEGKVIVNLSQCGIGTVEMGLYEASSGLLERGVLSGMDMTLEAAITKIMWVLGTQYGAAKEYEQIQINQRGEQTENLFDLRFRGVLKEDAERIYSDSVKPDGRLARDKITAATLRISKLGVTGAKGRKRVRINAFMNMPAATHDTPDTETRHVATVEVFPDEPLATPIRNITYKTQTVVGKGNVTLTLVPDSKDLKVFFSAAYIAIYARA